MAVSQDTIQKIKGVPVSSILEAEDVLLRKVGREFVTHCLWHKDTNPSLTISDDKGFVFCHVCQEHNDAIGYISKKYGINFRESCERIASKHNIDIKYDEENEEYVKERKLQLQKAYEDAENKQTRFRKDLKEYPNAINFIISRGIKPETSRYFGIGYDKNEQRITIPIYNHLDKIAGFTARTINDDIKPKYKNTENNLIFNKSSLVFNESKAADFIRQAEECVFVEGHLDVISLWQVGVKNVVALQGTASPSQDVINRLLKKAKRFVLCMDADQGGKKAIGKFLDSVQNLALDGQLEVRVAVLPDGQDPDDFIKSGNDIQSVINDAPSWMDWLLDEWLGGLDFNDKLKIQEVERLIKELFSRISSPALRAHYYDKASIRLAQNKQGLAAQIAKGFHEFEPRLQTIHLWQRPDPLRTRKIVEKRLIRLYLHRPEMRWILKPMLELMIVPDLIWLKNRIEEIEEFQASLDLNTLIIAILSVSEPRYMKELRSIVSPTIQIHDDELSIAHMEDIMTTDLNVLGQTISEVDDTEE